MPSLTPLATDQLAEQIAEDYLHSRCQHAILARLGNSLVLNITEALKAQESDEDTAPDEQDKEERVRPHSELFEALFKAIEPYERKFADFLRGIWEQERKIIIANLKKMKKAWLRKDKVDNILYPKNTFVRKITDGTKTQFEQIMETEGHRLIDVHEYDIAFDVNNPEVQKWLRDYTVGFGKALEGVSHEKLRKQLIEGTAKGESIPELMKRINGTYANWNRYRSEIIARTETLLAANKGAVETYRQSGVVKSKVWVTYHDRRTCPSCELLDGTVIGLEENFFNLGDPDEVIEKEGKTYTFKNDYRDIGEPPRHVSCRCAIAASFEEVSITKPGKLNFHKKLTRDEKKLIKRWSDTEYLNIRSWLGMTPEEKKRLLHFYRFEQHKQTWIKQQMKEAKIFGELFKKYADGKASQALYRSITDLKDSLYDAIKKYKKGDIFKVDRTVQSWTYDKNILWKHTHEGKNSVHFYLKAGRKHTQELDIERYSKFAFEKEVVVNNTEFKIIKIEESIKPIPNTKYKTKILKVYLEEIKPG